MTKQTLRTDLAGRSYWELDAFCLDDRETQVAREMRDLANSLGDGDLASRIASFIDTWSITKEVDE